MIPIVDGSSRIGIGVEDTLPLTPTGRATLVEVASAKRPRKRQVLRAPQKAIRSY